ncbi:NlpC/P60 family protein [Streptosporangium roseum]|uniref:NlpC/P60 family protein n=1 Tax=Streptosporangium roseum TaxID=2001 RepID=UPI00332AF7BC
MQSVERCCRAGAVVAGLACCLITCTAVPAVAMRDRVGPSAEEVARARSKAGERGKQLGETTALLAKARAELGELSGRARKLAEIYEGERAKAARAEELLREARERAGAVWAERGHEAAAVIPVRGDGGTLWNNPAQGGGAAAVPAQAGGAVMIPRQGDGGMVAIPAQEAATALKPRPEPAETNAIRAGAVEEAIQAESTERGPVQTGGTEREAVRGEAAERGPVQVESTERGPVQAGNPETWVVQVGNTETGSARGEAAETGSAGAGSFQVRAAETGSAETGSAWGEAAETGTAGAGSFQVRAAEAEAACDERREAAERAAAAKKAAEEAVARQVAETRRIEADRARLDRQVKAETIAADRLAGKRVAVLKWTRVAKQRARQGNRQSAAVARKRARFVAARGTVPTWPLNTTWQAARGDIAADWALTQLDKPYLWAATGPRSYDCSGLTMQAWARAGVRLDHWTGTQWTSGRHVQLSQVRRGDLLFFGRITRNPGDISHVGIYIGRGLMVHAPQTGDVVRVAPIWRRDLVGATRPD